LPIRSTTTTTGAPPGFSERTPANPPARGIAEAADSGWVSSYAYTWDGTQYVPVCCKGDTDYTIAMWQGFWVEQLVADSMAILFTPESMLPAALADEPPPKLTAVGREEAWALQLTVMTSNGKFRDTYNRAGINSISCGEYDRLDAFEYPPMSSQYVQLYFPHPEWDKYPYKYTYDYRPADFGRSESWDFTVAVGGLPNRELVLGWHNIDEIDDRNGFILTDANDGEFLADLRQAESFTFNSGDCDTAKFHFRLTAIRGDSELMPREFGLLWAYPNPFNRQLCVLFDLKSAGETALRVFDLQGRELALLCQGHQEAGVHRVVWDATGVASGVYLLNLQSSGENLTRKVLLVQ
jgi:hypothetical protein